VGESGAADRRCGAERTPFEQMQAATKLSREAAEAMMGGSMGKVLLAGGGQAREDVVVRAA
jgi:hypothetical protein